MTVLAPRALSRHQETAAREATTEVKSRKRAGYYAFLLSTATRRVPLVHPWRLKEQKWASGNAKRSSRRKAAMPADASFGVRNVKRRRRSRAPKACPIRRLPAASPEQFDTLVRQRDTPGGPLVLSVCCVYIPFRVACFSCSSSPSPAEKAC